MQKVLLLNNNYQVLSFINERKALKLLLKNKVDVISNWIDIKFHFSSGYIHLPAILRLKYFVNKTFSRLIFSRKAVLRRDRFICQYCSEHLNYEQATVDHVVPKSYGGASSFTNCVAACIKCNFKKGNRTPEEAEMTLIKKPHIPKEYVFYIPDKFWHDDWDLYVRT